jgi:predicted  nucleic acid-binding Zn-ribbon protein
MSDDIKLRNEVEKYRKAIEDLQIKIDFAKSNFFKAERAHRKKVEQLQDEMSSINFKVVKILEIIERGKNTGKHTGII